MIEIAKNRTGNGITLYDYEELIKVVISEHCRFDWMVHFDATAYNELQKSDRYSLEINRITNETICKIFEDFYEQAYSLVTTNRKNYETRYKFYSSRGILQKTNLHNNYRMLSIRTCGIFKRFHAWSS